MSPRCTRPLGALALLASACGSAHAATETITFTSVNSNGPLGSVVNSVRTATATGGFTVNKIRVSGSLQELNTSTFAEESRILVTAPNGTQFTLAPFQGQGDFSGTIVLNPVDTWIVDAATPSSVVAEGQFTFRFYESLDNGAEAIIDANWTTISFTLDSQPLSTPATEYQEAEQNDNKLEAQLIRGLADGERVSGFSTGAVTDGSGPTTADYFLIGTPAAGLGVYQHTLTLSYAGSFYNLSLRGDSQAAGAINTLSDVAVQNDVLNACAYFGFGKGEQIVARVTGSAANTTGYKLTLTTTQINPTDLGTIAPGETIITVDGGGDWDLWVYDADLNAIPGYGNDQSSSAAASLARTLTPGRYYLVIARGGLSNNQPSPQDDLARNGPVTDLPGALVPNTYQDSTSSATVWLTDSAGQSTAGSLFRNGWVVGWYSFTVGDPFACPDVDLNQDGGIDVADIDAFFRAFSGGPC